MKKLLALMALLLCMYMVGCDPGPVSTAGPELTEKAEVLQIIYQPGTKSDVKTTWQDTVFGSGNLPHTAKTIESPDKYSVAFKCQHGKFIIEDEGKGSRAERLWKTLDKGDTVEIRYQEVKGPGSVVNYKFIDAIRIQK